MIKYKGFNITKYRNHRGALCFKGENGTRVYKGLNLEFVQRSIDRHIKFNKGK